jgi:hypothetical protein
MLVFIQSKEVHTAPALTRYFFTGHCLMSQQTAASVRNIKDVVMRAAALDPAGSGVSHTVVTEQVGNSPYLYTEGTRFDLLVIDFNCHWVM